MAEIRYVRTPNAKLWSTQGSSTIRKNLLLGQRVHVDLTSIQNGRVAARTVKRRNSENKMIGPVTGFVDLADLSAEKQLKIFYIDVGQGDATLIEAEGATVVIDAGPNKGFFNRMKRRLENLQYMDTDLGLVPRTQIEIDAVVISHFDKDHYYGLTRLLKSDKFKIGTIYHNGLPRYADGADKDLNLGTVTPLADGTRSISTDLTDLASAEALVASGDLVTDSGNENYCSRFLSAAIQASQAGRLGGLERLCRTDLTAPVEILPNTGPDMRFQVLAPVAVDNAHPPRLRAFPDPHDVSAHNPNPSPSESHTINGNSVVLRLVYGNNTFLFGGDLNQPSQEYLASRYGNLDLFKADVNKACHHGSSDFDLDYLKAVSPFATVFSSGDNASHDHPMPDAMGAAAKHSAGDFPLVFSTELARETSTSGINYGDINARSNGTTTVLAQRKERGTTKKRWHTFQLPYQGPFDH